ncbi:MAG: putative bifunctional diguanylate cyclase/phosphodiesterase [Solirubrobacteraceae bacterium]
MPVSKLTEDGSPTSAGRDDDGRSKLFDLAHDLLATIDSSGRFLDANPAWEQVLGWPRESLIGTRVIELLHPDDLELTLATRAEGASELVELENRYRRADGSYRWLDWTARRVGGTWYAVARDVTDRRLLREHALRDPLTGLPNRTAMIERLTHAVAKLERDPGLIALLFVDLDHFKMINDGRGHEVGDHCLRVAAARLLETVRGSDSVARLGGDEFVLLLEHAGNAADVAHVATRVVAALARPIEIGRDEVQLGGSVGVTMTASFGATAETMLREADIAMYRAKAQGGSCHVLFDDDLRAEVEQRVVVERQLRVAIDEQQFEIHYQPIVTLPDASINRCEALARWRRPGCALAGPATFIPLAEETGLIVGIGDLVLRMACRQASAWRRVSANVCVSVNVSTRQLAQPNFADSVSRILSVSDLPPAALCLELTETAITKDIAKFGPSLDALRRVGVQIAMDDFGSGYSSLRYLRLLPLDIIKIDRSFVRGIMDDAQDRAVVAGIINLGLATAREVIAEGVDSESLHAELVRLRCGLAQGFLYAQPGPPEQLVLGGYSGKVGRGVGDPLVIREFMRQIGIPARIQR